MSKVSIIIPLYNQGEFLKEAVDSALAQTYKDIEIIIVEDGSTDGKTPAIADTFKSDKVTVIHKENGGLANARNTGIEASKADFFVPLDSDDKIEEDFVEKTMKLMEESEKIGVVYTDQRFFGDENKLMPMKEYDFAFLLVKNHVSVCSLIRRKAYDDVKALNKSGYNPNMKFGYEDWDFWISVGEAGWEFRVVHEPLFVYRKRKTSMMSNTVKNHEFLIKQMMENHPESYAKHYKEAFVILQNILLDNDFLLRDLKDQRNDPTWLAKRLARKIFSKESKERSF